MLKERRRKAVCSAVAHILREERMRRGLSMTQVAVLSGLSQQMISYVEREIRVPGLDTLLRIADALDLDLADVMQRAGRLSG